MEDRNFYINIDTVKDRLGIVYFGESQEKNIPFNEFFEFCRKERNLSADQVYKLLREIREDVGFMICKECREPYANNEFMDPARTTKEGLPVYKKICMACEDKKQYKCRDCKEIKLGSEFVRNDAGIRQTRCKGCYRNYKNMA